MDEKTLFALILALVWGAVWALCLQYTRWGRFLALQRTWITVVVGIGGDLVILLLCMPFELWWRGAAVIAASSMAIIARSLINEYRDAMELVNADQDEIGE